MLLYQTLFQPQNGGKLEMPGLQEVKVAVRRWFHGREGRWLWVFDNADTILGEGQIEGDSFVDIGEYLPEAPQSGIIVTTRALSAQDMIGVSASIAMHAMSLGESCELFCKCAKLQSGPSESNVLPIVEELGHLPLAVSLAGKYVAQQPDLRHDLSLFLPEYRQKRQSLLSQQPRRLIDRYSESVLTTWETSFKIIESTSPSAARLISLLAFFNPTDVSMDLFVDGSGLALPGNNIMARPAIMKPVVPAEFKVSSKDFSILRDYYFLEYHDASASYSLHPLVHTWSYERLSADDQRWHVQMALKLLVLAAYQKYFRMSGITQRLVPHLYAITSILFRTYCEVDDSWGELVGNLSLIYEGFFKWPRDDDLKLRIATFLRQGCEQAWGAGNNETLLAMAREAVALHGQQKHEEAMSIQQKVVETRQKVHGECHRQTLRALAVLAYIQTSSGAKKPKETLMLCREVVTKAENAFGEGDTLTLYATEILADELSFEDRPKEELKLRYKVHDSWLRMRDEGKVYDDSSLLRAQIDLEQALCKSHKWEEALSVLREALYECNILPAYASHVKIRMAIVLRELGRLDESPLMQDEDVDNLHQRWGYDYETVQSIVNSYNLDRKSTIVAGRK